MRIPNGTEIHKGELLYSYIVRLAKANGLSPDIFTASYVWPNQDVGNRKLIFSSLQPLTGFFDSASDYIDDPLRFFMEHSIYPAIGPLSYSFHQAHIINAVFEQGERYPELTGEIQSPFSEIHICPECAKAELQEHGYYWFHREHQVPGVRVCSEHHCNLLSCSPSEKTKYRIELKDFAPISDIVTDFDMKYAKFCKEFLKCEFSTNWEHLRKIISAQIKQQYYPEDIMQDRYQRFADAISESDATSYLGNDPVAATRQVVYGKGSITAKLALLCVLFNGDVNKISGIALEDNNIRNEFFDFLGQYSLISSYNETGVTLRHEPCGSEFIVTPYGFLTGWTCPSCNNKSTEAMFEHLCRRIEHDAYIPQEPFRELSESVTMRHKDCGQPHVTTPYKFLYQNVRCDCEHKVTKKESKERLLKAGFKLNEFNGFEAPAILRGIDCHHKFEVDSLYTFLRHPSCPICNPQRKLRNPLDGITEEHFRRRIQELTGNEYILIGEYKTARVKTELLHDKKHGGCGKTFFMTPEQFTRGLRCPYCSPRIMKGAIPNILHDVSLGTYTAVPSKNRTYDVTNTKTGEKMNLTGMRILQELKRPTKSPILPLGRKNLDAIQKYYSSTERVRLIIHNLFKPGSLIYAEEIDYKNAGLTNNQYRDGIKALCHAGEIEPVHYRVYRYTSDNWTKEEIESEIANRKKNRKEECKDEI